MILALFSAIMCDFLYRILEWLIVSYEYIYNHVDSVGFFFAIMWNKEMKKENVRMVSFCVIASLGLENLPNSIVN